MHELLADQLRAWDRLDLDTAVVDGSHVRALKGRRAPCPSIGLGSKHHVISDAGGVPLAVRVTGDNRHDSTQLIPLVEALPALRGKRGRGGQRPRWLYGDRGYDYDHHRKALRERGIVPRIARENTARGAVSAPSGGSWNAPSPGCTSSHASAPATNDASTSTSDSSNSDAP